MTRASQPWMIALALAAMVIVAGVRVAPGRAAAVEVVRIPIDATTTSSAACGIPIVRYDSGVAVAQIRITADGALVQSVHFTQ